MIGVLFIYFITKLYAHNVLQTMNNAFDSQIFGDLIQPTTVSSVVKKTSKIKNKQQQISYQQVLNENRKNGERRKNSPYTENHYFRSSIQKQKSRAKGKQLSTISTQADLIKVNKSGNSEVKIRNIVPEDLFDCIMCRYDDLKNYGCALCGGSGKVRGNSNLVKFIDYLTQFKLGLRKVYKVEEKDERQAHYQNRGLNIENLSNSYNCKMKGVQNIHRGYVCDGCGATPIVGARYHCNHRQCENNYDLCESCYLECDHKHNLQQIRQSQINKRLKMLRSHLMPSSAKDLDNNRVISSSIY